MVLENSFASEVFLRLVAFLVLSPILVLERSQSTRAKISLGGNLKQWARWTSCFQNSGKSSKFH